MPARAAAEWTKIMDYQAAMEFISGTQPLGSRLGLDTMRKLLSYLDNPQDKLRYVHVAGTNGKGSTSAFLSTILTEAGYITGLFTSPSLHSYNERIRVNNNNISNDDFAKSACEVKYAVERMMAQGTEHPTEFELVTAMAYLHFVESKCDVVILEVGLGGTDDATNIIHAPEIAVITSISFDHMAQLGNTLREIAAHKAGIIKKGCDTVLYPQSDEVRNVVTAVCENVESGLFTFNEKEINAKTMDLDGQTFDFAQRNDLKISLLGTHQLMNAATAITAADVLAKKGWRITDEAIRRGLIGTKWPGRLEILQKDPIFLVDGAHNDDGVRTLSECLKRLFSDKRITMITGVLADKEFEKMMQRMIPLASRFLTITPDNTRALSADKLADYLKQYHNHVTPMGSVREAIETALRETKKDEVICAFGSLYYVADVRGYFIKEI